MSEMSIETLLQAAEYLERREREAEHGYASSLPSPAEYQIIKNTRLNKNTTKKPQGNRYVNYASSRVYVAFGIEMLQNSHVAS